MFNYIQNVFNKLFQQDMSESALKNEVGLSKDLITLLKADFRRLDAIDGDLPAQIVRYVVDGEETDFILTFSAMISGKTFKNINYDFAWKAPHAGFFRKYDLNDAMPLFRLAEVYGVVSQNQTISNKIHYYQNFNFANADLAALTATLIHAFQQHKQKFSIELFDKIFELASDKPDTLAQIIYALDLKTPGWTYYHFRNEIVKFKGFVEFSLRHAEVIREALRLPKAEQRLYALEILNKQNVPLESFVEDISRLACSSAKSERNEASFLIKKIGDSAIPHLQKIAADGNPTERANAVKLLFEFQGETSFDFLKTRLETDKSANVRETIDDLMNSKNAVAIDDAEFNLTVPPPPEIAFNEPLSKEFFAQLQEAMKKVDEASHNYFGTAGKYFKPKKKPTEITDGSVKSFFELLQNGTGEDCRKFRLVANQYESFVQPNVLPTFVASPEIKPIHLIRFALILQNKEYQDALWQISQVTSETQLNPQRRFGLPELTQILRILGVGDQHITTNLLNRYHYYNPLANFINDETVWHFLFDKQDELEKFLYGNEADKRVTALTLLGKFPQIPPRFRLKLWEFALGKTKAERAVAQICLRNDKQGSEKLLDALKHRSAETRAIAAEWLGNSNEKTAIEALHEAIKKEKSDIAKDQMLRSLEKLGASVEQYLDRDVLFEDAKNNIKGDVVKKTVAWLNVDLLPKIKWADTKKEVAPEILTWFIVQTVKQKQIEPSPLLRRYFEKFEKTGGEKFGQFALESWIAADTQPIPADEAETRAKSDLASAKTYWQYWQKQNFTEDSYFQKQFNLYLKKPKGSAIKEKGILAIAAASGSAAIVPSIERFVREFHGHRLKQSIALVEVLGEVGDTNAIQVLLSIANRFRTKGIQEEAKRQVDLTAERNNWTLDELADRTIPTLGFDEKGVMTLDYGSRQFTAKLDKDFNFILFDAQNKKLKSLPIARKEDDADLAKDAKTTFTNAKKSLKQILTLQKERLYEAMSGQRSWKFADWQTFLNGHPILRRYCQTLIWQLVDDENSVTFRPLDDGTLTDFDDNEVLIDDEKLIKLAHQQTVSPEISESWNAHLSDYEVSPIFPQFGREMPELSDKELEATEIKNFEGFMIETFKLRGKATASGFTRGQAEDGGWFYYYKKNFPNLELDAFVEFTGNGLPEESRNVALIALSFAKTNAQNSGYLNANKGLKIKDVPSVVLCEVWNDMKTIANAGTGFDVDWKKKSEY